jgi:hypothetical protein
MVMVTERSDVVVVVVDAAFSTGMRDPDGCRCPHYTYVSFTCFFG